MTMTGCKDGKPDPNEFTGEYTLSEKPLYSSMTATDPNAVAFKMEGDQPMQLTYAEVIAAAYGYLPTVKVGETKVTFGKDGSLRVIRMNDGNALQVFPKPEDGLMSSFMTYSLESDNLILNITSEMINYLLKGVGEESDIKDMLDGFNKGVLVYNAESNSISVNLKYRKTNNDLYIYIDKVLLGDTWECVEPLAGIIIAMMEEADPGSTKMAPAIVLQLTDALTGFTKIEAGAMMTKL